MSPAQTSLRFADWAGLALGPLAWAMNTQANYALVAWDCFHESRIVALVALVFGIVAAAGAAISGRAWRRASVPLARFVAAIASLLAGLMTIVILTQGAASLVLAGCER